MNILFCIHYFYKKQKSPHKRGDMYYSTNFERTANPLLTSFGISRRTQESRKSWASLKFSDTVALCRATNFGKFDISSTAIEFAFITAITKRNIVDCAGYFRIT